MWRISAVLVAGFLLMAGCDTEALEALEEQTGVVRVDAPAGKCWSGSIGDSTKDGCGSKSFTVEGESIVGAVVQKETPGRWVLSATLTIQGEEVDSAETSAKFGVLEVFEG